MCKIILGLVFVLFSYCSSAQVNAELGIWSGVGNYLGDINPNNQFYPAKLTMGGLFRYNFNARYSLRVNMLATKLEANDLDFDNYFQQKRRARFATGIVDFSVLCEFNFQPFWVPKRSFTKVVTPYLLGGIGYVYSGSTTSSVAIPMGLGLKSNLGGRWTGALEWTFRKTFTDNLDNLDAPVGGDTQNSLHNNDWLSFIGVIISYRLFPENKDCQAYERYIK